jgi:uncharacterized membrane protein
LTFTHLSAVFSCLVFAIPLPSFLFEISVCPGIIRIERILKLQFQDFRTGLGINRAWPFSSLTLLPAILNLTCASVTIQIAVMMRNSLQLMEIHFAAARLGVQVLNLNTNLTVEELTRQLDTADCCLVICGRAFHDSVYSAAGDLPGMQVCRTCLGVFGALLLMSWLPLR